MNKVLKITDNNEYNLPAKDIAAIHYGYCQSNGEVTYTTGIPFDNNNNIENILLMVGNKNPVFYWCHVKYFHSYGKGNKDIDNSIDMYSPAIYKAQSNTTWILFDKMELIPQSLTNILCNQPDLLQDLIEKPRSNQKNI